MGSQSSTRVPSNISVMCNHLYHLIFYALMGMASCVLRLSPEISEAERYVNDTYIVTCISENSTAETSWSGPEGLINSTRGRVHVEIGQQTENRKELRLVFEEITRQDRGNYICYTSSRTVNQPRQKISFQLLVVKPISFSMADDFQNVTENKSALIRCEVFGDPKPTILWHAKGRVVQGERYKVIPSGLYISNVSLEDEGEYDCKAYQITSRTSNMQNKIINLTVLYSPRWKDIDGNTSYGYMGSTANLTCEAVGKPPPDYRWTRNGLNLDPNTTVVVHEPKRSVLMVKMVDKKVLGQYECIAANSVGTIIRRIILEEGVKPSPPVSVNVHSVTASTALLEVIPPATINGRLIGYRVEFTKAQDDWSRTDYQDIQTDDSGSLITIVDLCENTDYYFRVATKSDAGLSDFTDQLGLTTSSALTLISNKYFVILTFCIFTKYL